MPIENLLGATAQLAAGLVVGWVSGGMLAERLRPGHELGLLERALLAVVGLVAASVALMLLHMATGGSVFGVAPVVPVIALAFVLWGRRFLIAPRPARPWRAVVFLVLVVALYAMPVAIAGSSVRTGDPPLHLGWTEQLLAGDGVPTGMAPAEFSRNAYPWGYHALLATLVRLVPGTDPIVAHEALHFLFLLALPLVAACLARLLDRRAGWAAALAASAIGGFGWIAANNPYYVASPSEAEFGADLVAGSPNGAYELYPPVLPREIGLLLLGTGAIWMIVCVVHADRRAGILGGICAGLAALVNLPLFLPVTFWTIAAAAAARAGQKLRTFAWMYVPALIVLLLWGVRVAADYVRYGGFVNVTPKLGVEWPLDSALWSWGLLLPCALIGGVVAVRASRGAARVFLALLAASATLLVLGFGRAAFDWQLLGNQTLLHQGRVWPPVHLIASAFAGVFLIRAFDRITRRWRIVGLIGAWAFLVLGATSLVFASTSITDIIRGDDKGFMYARSDVVEGSFVDRAAAHLGPDTVVRVAEEHEVGFLLFQLSGTRLVGFDDPNRPENELRIRFADLAARWEEARAAGAIEADYLVIPAGDPTAPAGEVLEEGRYEDREWQLINPGS